MALAEPMFIQRAPLTNGPSFQTQPFDIDLLCAKLEVAKLEQDAERARQRLRQLTNRKYTSPNSSRNETPTQQAPILAASTQSAERSRLRVSTDAQCSLQPKQLFTAAVSIARPDSDQSHDHPNIPIRSPRRHESIKHYAPRNRDDDQPLTAITPHPSIPKRKPVARMSESNVNAYNAIAQWQTTIEPPPPRDMTNRRSNTLPLPQAHKLPLKHGLITGAYDPADIKEQQQHHRPRKPLQPIRAATMTSHDRPDSSMGLVNEYTISFDLADHPRAADSPPCKQLSSHQLQQQQPDSQRIKSFIAIPLLTKKEKSFVKTEELVSSPLEQSPTSPLRATAATNPAWHLRQQSLPVDFSDVAGGGGESEQRPTWIAEGQPLPPPSKRRSLVGWLKKF